MESKLYWEKYASKQAKEDILTGEWGMHESDWFRDNGVVIATHAIERALEAEAEALKYKEAYRHVLDILNVVSEIVVETKNRSENDTSQYAHGQYDLCLELSTLIGVKVMMIGLQDVIEKMDSEEK